MSRLVFGVGLNDVDSHHKAYPCWKGMLRRCYSQAYSSRHPSYVGCCVCQDWIRLSGFVDWYNDHIIDGYHLDKDILVPGNKVYGPTTCSFVPPKINNLLLDRARDRGCYKLGVFWYQRLNKWGACLSQYGKRKHIGNFETEHDASVAYVEAKKAYVKRVALEAFLNNEIKSDVYLALVRREF